MIVLSLDIDGTLKEYGGPITPQHIIKAKKKGSIVGGGSSRSVRSQRTIWKQMKIKPDFIVFKNNLPTIKARYPKIEKFYHVDDMVKDIHGFQVLRPKEFLKKFDRILHSQVEEESEK